MRSTGVRGGKSGLRGVATGDPDPGVLPSAGPFRLTLRQLHQDHPRPHQSHRSQGLFTKAFQSCFSIGVGLQSFQKKKKKKTQGG